MIDRALLVVVLAFSVSVLDARQQDNSSHDMIPSRTSFTATVYVKDNNTFHGGLYGTMRYDFVHGMYEIKLTSRRHVELYKYNQERGMGGSLRPYVHQFSYVCSDGCDCTVGALDHSMPLLFHDSTFYDDEGPIHLPGFDTFSGYSNCRNDGSLCWAAFKDGRQHFFVNQVESYFLASDFEPPLNVRCSKSIDLCIAVDRSTSVTRHNWELEKDFLRRFVQQLFIGATQVHVAIVSYNTNAWLELTLAQGTTYQNTINAVENMACNASTEAHSQLCQEGWTSLSSGISECADALWGSPRSSPDTAKAILLLTDGYHNMLRRQSKRKGPYVPHNETRDLCYQDCWAFVEGTSEWFECAAKDLAWCRDDLVKAVQRTKTMLQNVQMIALGIGGTVSDDELLLIAQNNTAHVVRRASFADLQTSSVELVARVCDTNPAPCGEHCCGFCACSRCQRPDFCDNRLFCTRDVLDGTCCSSVPRGCATDTSMCLMSECHDEACHTEPKTCPPRNGCFSYECNESSGVCVPYPSRSPSSLDEVVYCNHTTKESVTRRKCIGSVQAYAYTWNAPLQQCEARLATSASPVSCVSVTECPISQDECYEPQCTDLHECQWIQKDCNDGRGCTDDTCVNGSCQHTPKNCDDLNPCTLDLCDASTGECVYKEVQCNDFNECTVDSCSFAEGCVHAPLPESACDDNDLCTTDRCEPAFGCVHDPVRCLSDDLCFLPKCERFRGCFVEPLVCHSQDNCSLGYCETTLENAPACRIERLQCENWSLMPDPVPPPIVQPAASSPPPTWSVITIAFSCVVLAGLVAFAVYFYLQRRRQQRYAHVDLAGDNLEGQDNVLFHGETLHGLEDY